MLRQVSLEELNQRNPNTLMERLGMVCTAVGPDWLEGKMPVDNGTRQVHGVLHGGASAALIESLGSIAASLAVDLTTHHCVGVEINANHVRRVTEGWVYGRATALHVGRTLHVWQVHIRDQAQRLVCTGRLTVAVLGNKPLKTT